MAALREAGWRLSTEGEQICGNSAKTALDLDLRDIGAEWIPEDINRGKATLLEGGCILQVTIFNCQTRGLAAYKSFPPPYMKIICNPLTLKLN